MCYWADSILPSQVENLQDPRDSFVHGHNVRVSININFVISKILYMYRPY